MAGHLITKVEAGVGNTSFGVRFDANNATISFPNVHNLPQQKSVLTLAFANVSGRDNGMGVHSGSLDERNNVTLTSVSSLIKVVDQPTKRVLASCIVDGATTAVTVECPFDARHVGGSSRELTFVYIRGTGSAASTMEIMTLDWWQIQ
jgi:hypothetical protein